MCEKWLRCIGIVSILLLRSSISLQGLSDGSLSRPQSILLQFLRWRVLLLPRRWTYLLVALRIWSVQLQYLRWSMSQQNLSDGLLSRPQSILLQFLRWTGLRVQTVLLLLQLSAIH